MRDGPNSTPARSTFELWRVLVNSQTGGAGFKVCFGYGGVNCSGVVRATGEYDPYDMTPINSIVLVK